MSTVIFFSGRALDLRAPNLDGFTIEDFALPLSREARWRGNTLFPYWVAQHCVHTSHLVDPAFAYDALCHDLEEAITSDIITPLKELFGRQHVEACLAPLKTAIARHFGFAYPEPPAVHHVDRVALATEIRDLKAPYSGNPRTLPPPGRDPLRPMTPPQAYEAFLARFHEVRRQRGAAQQSAA